MEVYYRCHLTDYNEGVYMDVMGESNDVSFDSTRQYILIIESESGAC